MMINIRYIILFNFYVVSYFIDKNIVVIWLKWIKEILLEVFLLLIVYVFNFINIKIFKWVVYKY